MNWKMFVKALESILLVDGIAVNRVNVTAGQAAYFMGCSSQTARKHLNAAWKAGEVKKEYYAKRGAVVEYTYIWSV